MMSGSVCSDFHGRIMNAFFFCCNAWRSRVPIYVVLYLKHFRLSESFEGYVMWMIRYSKSFKSILSRGTFFWPGNECSTMNVIKSLRFVFIYILHIFKNYLFIYFYYCLFIVMFCICCNFCYLLGSRREINLIRHITKWKIQQQRCRIARMLNQPKMGQLSFPRNPATSLFSTQLLWN